MAPAVDGAPLSHGLPSAPLTYRRKARYAVGIDDAGLPLLLLNETQRESGRIAVDRIDRQRYALVVVGTHAAISTPYARASFASIIPAVYASFTRRCQSPRFTPIFVATAPFTARQSRV